ncbi:MAG: hypothetical protein LBT69_03475 [Lactobacillales bacterium]|nr:hypothetical protein [Lactobacillales bacterium]
MSENYDNFWFDFYESERLKVRKDEDYDSECDFNQRYKQSTDNKSLEIELLSYLKAIDQSYKDFKEIVSDYELRIFENFLQECFRCYDKKILHD